jgi:16S rRNA (guanine966-N2)-methyltransferase
MRIVAGRYGGRRLVAPKGASTRPTTDRVREALFSSLVSHSGPSLGGGAVLDAFAGSGALGFEALSRGAARVTFVERDPKALAALRANAESLSAGDSARIIAGDVSTLAARGGLSGGPFSLLLLDPPYRLDAGEVRGLIASLVGRDLLEDGAIVVYEHAAGGSGLEGGDLAAVASKRYGSTQIDIVRWERGAGSA